MMLVTPYLVGFIIAFVYFGLRLNRSQIRVDMEERIFAFVISSLFWFVSIPYLILVGDLFKSQRELDEEIYEAYVDAEIDEAIASMETPPYRVQSFRDNLRKEIGTFQDMVDNTKP
jgi:hypothetical protein